MTGSGCWIIGAGGLARGTAEALRSSGRMVAGIVAKDVDAVRWFDGAIVSEEVFLAGKTGTSAIVAIGDNALRIDVVRRYREAVPDLQWTNAIHRAAGISVTADIGEGAIILAGAIISANTVIGRHVVVYSGCVIEHDCTVGDYASFGPAAALGGGVRIGDATFIGLGARVGHGISIGADTVVGIGSVVIGNLPDHVTAYGTPCRAVRTRMRGERYL
jgi:sugar O-acyltransferase (sialic acid O-acetyltransferase NeuD family)